MTVQRRLDVMKTKTRARLLVAATVGFLGVGVVACSSHHDSDVDAGPGEDISDVLYEGGTNDEALKALVASQAQSTVSLAFTAPVEAQKVPKGTPFAFAWSELKQASLSPTRRQRSWSDRALELLEGTAWAHGEPVNGPGFLVTFSTATKPKLVRLFTTKMTFTPIEVVWSKLASVNEPIQIRVRAAFFEESRIATGGGPFQGPIRAFTIVP